MDKIRDIFSYFVAAMAIFALLGAVYQAFLNEKGSAFALGTLFLIGALIVFLPQVEYIKTLGVEARLKESYKEAVATVATVRRLAEISARASYLIIAWGNRFDGPSAKERQAVLDQIDGQLTELKVTSEQRADIQRPFASMVKLDFYFLFNGVLMQYATLLNSQLVANVHSAKDPSVASGAVMHHSDLMTAWSTRTHNHNPAADLDHQSLEKFLNDYMPKSGEWLDEKELQVMEKFKREIVRLNEDCEKKGGYTAEAAEYYDRYGRDHNIDKAAELRREIAR